MREMRAIDFVTRLIDEKRVTDGSLRRMLIHSISADDQMAKLSASSKLNTDWDFLMFLRDTGRQVAETWLEVNFNKIGSESTVDIQRQYM
jgi:NTE family protein